MNSSGRASMVRSRARRRAVVFTEGSPRSSEAEQALFGRWRHVSVSGEIVEHRLGSAAGRWLCVENIFFLLSGANVGKGLSDAGLGAVEERQPPRVGVDEPARNLRKRREAPGPVRDAVSVIAPARSVPIDILRLHDHVYGVMGHRRAQLLSTA